MTDRVIRQGGIVTIATWPTSNSLLRISACQHVLALGKLFDHSQYQNLRLSVRVWNDYNCNSHFQIKSEFWNPEPVIIYQV